MKNTRFTCVNVGYGDAFILEADEVCLIDTGSGQNEEYREKGRNRVDEYLKYRCIYRIDKLVITHIHEDHVGCLDVLLRDFEIGTIYIPKGFADIDNIEDRFGSIPHKKNSTPLFYRALLIFARAMRMCKEKGIAVCEIDGGNVIHVGEFSLRAMNTKKEKKELFLKYSMELNSVDNTEEYDDILEKMDSCSNATSLLLKCICGNKFRGLLTADNIPANWEVNTDFINNIKDINFLKIPHHAQADAVSEEIMKHMPLQACLTTASSDCRYGSSNRYVYETLLKMAKNNGRELYCLFSDPPADCEVCRDGSGYRALEFEPDYMEDYKIIF